MLALGLKQGQALLHGGKLLSKDHFLGVHISKNVEPLVFHVREGALNGCLLGRDETCGRRCGPIQSFLNMGQNAVIRIVEQFEQLCRILQSGFESVGVLDREVPEIVKRDAHLR